LKGGPYEGSSRCLHGFQERVSPVNTQYEALGREIHETGGPLPEKVRWLIKVAVSAASQHRLSLETHIAKAREAGATEAEIAHALLMVMQTTGFPTFMESYSVFKNMK
jgi:4-carboxymuconolactone decarboxylase